MAALHENAAGEVDQSGTDVGTLAHLDGNALLVCSWRLRRGLWKARRPDYEIAAQVERLRKANPQMRHLVANGEVVCGAPLTRDEFVNCSTREASQTTCARCQGAIQ